MPDTIIKIPAVGTLLIEKKSDAGDSTYATHLSWGAELTADEFTKYKDANRALGEFRADMALFEMVILNYREYHSALEFYRRAYINRDAESFSPEAFSLNVNRHFLNWMSSIRSYLDHTETRIKRRHGKGSQIWQSFDKQCSDAFDNEFAYRFVYKLRNYSQHCGVPLHVLKFRSRAKKDGPHNISYSLKVGCNRKRLLDEYDGWGARLKADIAAQPEEIEIHPLMDIVMKAIEAINSSHIDSEIALLKEHAIYLATILQRAPNDGGSPGVFEVEVERDNTGRVIGYKSFEIYNSQIELVKAILNGNLNEMFGNRPDPSHGDNI